LFKEERESFETGSRGTSAMSCINYKALVAERRGRENEGKDEVNTRFKYIQLVLLFQHDIASLLCELSFVYFSNKAFCEIDIKRMRERES
jgi:hypothetical protein